MPGAVETAAPQEPTGSTGKSNTGAFATITLLFFFWGFITVMNDVLIPYLKGHFGLSYFQASLVQFAFFGAFFVISLLYFACSSALGDPINRLGYKRSIVAALFVCGVGCGLFAPAAMSDSYVVCLAALFTIATGITLLQIAANPYAAVLGKPENASARLNLAQGVNSLGTTLAPIVGGLLTYKVFASEEGLTLDAIKAPYLIYGGIALALAIVVGFLKLPSIGSGDKEETGNAFSFPQLRLGMGAIFLYVGAEVAIGSYLVNFMADKRVMGWEEGHASLFLAYYWGGAMIGRLCGAIAMTKTESAGIKPVIIPATAMVLMAVIYVATAVDFSDGQLVTNFIPIQDLAPFAVMVALCLGALALGRGKPASILTVFSLAIVLLLLTASFGAGKVALWAALGAGLFNSIMWSNIFTLAIDDLGEHTSQGSSLLVMMIVGGALFPPVMGLIADRIGLQLAFLVPVASYVYIAYYGWWSQQRINAKAAV